MDKKFVTIEGAEGVGKTTQINLLRSYFIKTHQSAVFTREPGGTPLSENIRTIILSDKLKEEMPAEAEAHLFAASRIVHIENLILPALSEGNIVLCDRYIDSSLAYQGIARGLGIDKVLEINRYAVENCMPSVTIFLDLNPMQSFRKQRGVVVENDRLEKESTEFHQKVYFGFKELASLYPERYVSIVPSRDSTKTASLIIAALRQREVIR